MKSDFEKNSIIIFRLENKRGANTTTYKLNHTKICKKGKNVTIIMNNGKPIVFFLFLLYAFGDLWKTFSDTRKNANPRLIIRNVLDVAAPRGTTEKCRFPLRAEDGPLQIIPSEFKKYGFPLWKCRKS